jgi:hypothetical protein
MTRPKVRRLTHETRDDARVRSLEEQLSEPRLLPGEDRHIYDAMARAIRKVLAPRDILQRLACSDIVNLRWEILRHRRLRQKSVERWFAADVSELYRNSDVRNPEGRKPTEDEQVRLSFATISEDPDRREAGEDYFDLKVGIDRDMILAEAYAAAPTVKVHDAKLNLLMRQHRQAMRDYNDLVEAEARKNVPDAEIVEDAA